MRGTIEVPAEIFAFLAELKSMFHPTRQQLSIADSVNLDQVCLGGRLVRSGPPGDGCVEKQNVSMFLPCPRSLARAVHSAGAFSPMRPTSPPSLSSPFFGARSLFFLSFHRRRNSERRKSVSFDAGMGEGGDGRLWRWDDGMIVGQ